MKRILKKVFSFAKYHFYRWWIINHLEQLAYNNQGYLYQIRQRNSNRRFQIDVDVTNPDGYICITNNDMLLEYFQYFDATGETDNIRGRVNTILAKYAERTGLTQTDKDIFLSHAYYVVRDAVRGRPMRRTETGFEYV